MWKLAASTHPTTNQLITMFKLVIYRVSLGGKEMRKFVVFDNDDNEDSGSSLAEILADLLTSWH
jgi:hypothetical protein